MRPIQPVLRTFLISGALPCPPAPASPRCTPRRTRRRLAVGVLVSSVAVGGLVIAGGSPASAATAPLAQSAGRFLDGSLGGNPVQQLADLTDARAKSPGTQTTQNPLNATVAGALNVPLTGALQLPTLAGIKLGAANQVAVAHADGYSYGASGAVANSGGVSVGGNNNAYPAGAEIDLDASALGALPTIPVPGASAAGALGAVKVKIGAVSSLAQTKSGGAAVPLGTNHYGIASLSLSLGSPALAGLLGQVTSQAAALNALLGPVQTILTTASLALPASCTITPGSLPSSISLDSGAIVIDVATGTISLDVAKLLQVLGLNINSLPANTDLLSYVLTQLPTILAAGLPAVVNGIITPLETAFGTCVTDLGGGALGVALGSAAHHADVRPGHDREHAQPDRRRARECSAGRSRCPVDGARSAAVGRRQRPARPGRRHDKPQPPVHQQAQGDHRPGRLPDRQPDDRAGHRGRPGRRAGRRDRPRELGCRA